MVKTLRVTGVAAVAFAGVVLASVLGPVSWIHLDSRNDQQTVKILDAPSAVERFQKQHAGKDPTAKDTKPPLVVQAETFKGIIDPKPVAAKETTPTAVAPPRLTPSIKPPVATSAKFTLVGTSCSPSNPSDSLAYISVDNTFKWVPCGSEVGRLTIKEVREGSVICWDGTQESEVAMEPVQSRVSLLEADTVAPTSGTAPQPVEVQVVEPPAGRTAVSQAQTAVPPLNDDEHEALGDLAERLRKLQNQPGDGPATKAERRAAIDRLMAEFNSSRVSPQETQKLEGLGKEPGDVERVREEQKRELLKRLNTRSSKN